MRARCVGLHAPFVTRLCSHLLSNHWRRHRCDAFTYPELFVPTQSLRACPPCLLLSLQLALATQGDHNRPQERGPHVLQDWRL